MRSQICSNHFADRDGNPAGGTTYGNGFAIGWQNGPLGRDADRQEPNGAFVEDIIAAVIDRIEFYQKTRFFSDLNARTLAHLYAGLESQQNRTRDREARKVEGTHEV